MIEPDAQSGRHLGRNVLAVAAVLTLLIGATWATVTTAADPNVAAVQGVVTDTVIAEQRIGVIPAGTSLTAVDVDRMVSDAAASAKSHYAGPLLAKMLEQYQAATADAAQAGEGSSLDGGIKDVQMGKTTVRGDTATVRMRATRWAKVAVGDKTFTPAGIADFTFELTKIDGQWYVTSETWDYLPGQGP